MHASSVLNFSSTSSCQIFLTSSEYIIKYRRRENPSMRALAKILRARASEHPCDFCKQFEQRPNLASSFTD